MHILDSIHDAVMGVLSGGKIQYSNPTPDTAPQSQTSDTTQAIDPSKFHNQAQMDKYQKMIETAAKKANLIDPSRDYRPIIASLLSKESSWGTDKRSYNPDIGKSAWLVGMTKGAAYTLAKNDIKTNLNTDQGAINAAAAYYALMNKGNTRTNEGENYLKSYQGSTDANIAQQFNDRYNYYAGVYKPKTNQ